MYPRRNGKSNNVMIVLKSKRQMTHHPLEELHESAPQQNPCKLILKNIEEVKTHLFKIW
jgi:hypothetical protein